MNKILSFLILIYIISNFEIEEIDREHLMMNLNHYDHLFLLLLNGNCVKSDFIKNKMAVLYYKHQEFHVNNNYVFMDVKKQELLYSYFINKFTFKNKKYHNIPDINKLHFPSILYFKKKELLEVFDVSQRSQNIENILHEIFIRNNFIKIKNLEEFNNYKKKEKTIILFNGPIQSEIIQELTEVIPSHKNEDLILLWLDTMKEHSLNDEIIKINSLYIYRNFDKKLVKFDGIIDMEDETDLHTFVYNKIHPPLLPLEGGGYDKLIKHNNHGIVLFIREDNENTQNILSEFEKAADELNNRGIFTFCYLSEKVCIDFIEHLEHSLTDIKKEYFVRFILKHSTQHDDSIDIFKLPDNTENNYIYDKDGFINFFNSFFSNKLEYFALHEKENELDSQIKILTHYSYLDFINNSSKEDKDCVILFYRGNLNHDIKKYLDIFEKILNITNNKYINFSIYNLEKNSKLHKGLSKKNKEKMILRLVRDGDKLFNGYDHIVENFEDSINFLIDRFTYNIKLLSYN